MPLIIWWAVYLVVAVVMMALSYLLTKSPKQPKNEQTFETPTAEEGKIIGLLYGTALIKDPNILAYWGLRIVTDYKKGGKKPTKRQQKRRRSCRYCIKNRASRRRYSRSC